MKSRSRFDSFLLGAVYSVAALVAMEGLLRGALFHLDLTKYGDGLEQAPYQQRVLMVPVERWAEHSSFIRHLASRHPSGALQDPGYWPIEFIGVAALLLTGLVACRLYRLCSRRRRLEAIVFPVVLVVTLLTFENFTGNSTIYPYDLPSMFFFTLALLLAMQRRYILLCLLMPLATLNRETTFFLIPAVALMSASEARNKTGPEAKTLWARGLATVLWLSVCWYLVTRWELKHFPGVGSEKFSHIAVNLSALKHPLLLDHVLAALGFLWVLLLFKGRTIPDLRLRALLWLYPIWAAVMVYYGILSEIRIYGELVPLCSVMSLILFEEMYSIGEINEVSVGSPA
jgi:hypothetical protein